MDARRIVEQAMPGSWPLGLSDPVGSRALPYVRQLVQRRAAGEPLQYVLGRWGFRNLELFVDRRVLIPRPETEQVVEVALAELRRLAADGTDEIVIVDLGTGSGAIALSLAAEGEKGAVWATDQSADALAVARANLAGMAGRAATRVRLSQGSWWDALPGELRGRVSLAVSNPPYVSRAEMAELPEVVADWEPHDALEAGPTGLESLEAIIVKAPAWLSRPAALVVEMAPHQAPAVAALAESAGFAPVRTEADLAGRPRALVARLA
ncbi:MAG TPA: peptide chain release factor N(5)-glutamine methyltransferase [Acidimicrobiales bacterium]|jgi:release factor glutamine methyltransferase